MFIVQKPMVFYESFETHDILWRFLKPMIFYEGFETHGILQRL